MFRAAASLILAFSLTTLAHAAVALVGGKVAKITDRGDRSSATVRFIGDSLLPLQDLLCASSGTSSVRFSAGTSAAAFPAIDLPCANWKLAGSALKYTDKSAAVGGVKQILYKANKLILKLKGPAFSPLAGPLPFLEVRFKANDVTYCGRFETLKRNEPDRILAKGPSLACQPLCGDGEREGAEACDGADLNGATCESLGEGAGTLGCTGSCQFDTSGCAPAATCGNDLVEPGETCDDGNASDGDCCSGTCQLDSNGTTCGGDGNICTDDVCDGAGECQHVANADPCDDGQSCTVGDVCEDGVCGGAILAPWLNEVDYDDLSGGGVLDRDEFLEIAGPAGLDLSGYYIVSVEGNQSCLTGIDPNTGVNTPTGQAHFVAQIPPGAVLGDDSGSGIGLYVACFKHPINGTSTSSDVGAACSDTLPAINSDENLKNGNLTNAADFDCPDGILLLDPEGDTVDAVSWEGIVPNTGALSFGGAFHQAPVAPAYSLPRDEGGYWPLGADARGVSIAKTTSTLARATAAAQWSETGGCITQDPIEILLGNCAENSATPGALNATQSSAVMQCVETAPGCGNGVVDPGEDCETSAECGPGWVCTPGCACSLATLCGNGDLDAGEQCDEGAGNSNAPNATCRTDCTEQRCGDGVLDDLLGETCEESGHCAMGEGCFQCGCTAPLGSVTFSVVPGPVGTCPADDGQSTFLKVGPALAGVCSGTNGDFNPASFTLQAGAPGPDGRASLSLANGPVVVGASLPDPFGITVQGYACFQITQDPNHVGWVDCDGGSNASAALSVDSNGAGASGAPLLAVGAGGTDSGAGAAVLRVLLRAAATDSDAETCASADFASSTPLETVLTTGTALSTIDEVIQGGLAAASLTGVPFDCGSWVENGPASLVMPNANMDVTVPVLGTQDIAQALRLND